MNSEPNPEMLVLARDLRGLSQPELTTASGIPQARLSRYETGLSLIPPNDLEALAAVLNFPAQFFYREGKRYDAESGELFHRKRRTASAGQLKRLYALLNVLRLNIQVLLEPFLTEDMLQIPEYTVSKFNGSIDDIAASVRAAWRIPTGPITNLTAALRDAFIFTFATDFGTDQIDEIVQWVEPVPAIMLVNQRSPGDRLRFSMAHALGHLVMHHYSAPYPEMESEADLFASAFLMPTDDILEDFSKTKISLDRMLQLKPVWGVSIQALIHRAYDLDVISKTRYESLFQGLSRQGYRKNEPFSLDVEKPLLFQELWHEYEKESRYTISDLSRLLSIGEAELYKWYFPYDPPLRLVRKPTVERASDYQTSSKDAPA